MTITVVDSHCKGLGLMFVIFSLQHDNYSTVGPTTGTRSAPYSLRPTDHSAIRIFQES